MCMNTPGKTMDYATGNAASFLGYRLIIFLLRILLLLIIMHLLQKPQYVTGSGKSRLLGKNSFCRFFTRVNK